jgi:hypothetical protein
MTIWILSEHLTFTEAYELINPMRAKVSTRTTLIQEKIHKINGSTENDRKTRNLAIAKLKADQEKLEQYNKQITELQNFRKATHYSISDSEFLYYKQTLYAKGY